MCEMCFCQNYRCSLGLEFLNDLYTVYVTMVTRLSVAMATIYTEHLHHHYGCHGYSSAMVI